MMVSVLMRKIRKYIKGGKNYSFDIGTVWEETKKEATGCV